MANQLSDRGRLISSIIKFPSIPSILTELERVCANPKASVDDVVAVVERDPILASRVLRLANSSMYGFRHPVTGIHPACVALGHNAIRNLVVQATVIEEFSDGAKYNGFDPEELWTHCFKAAVAARQLCTAAPHTFDAFPDDAHTYGLLHDVGHVLMLHADRDRFFETLRVAEAKGVSAPEAEDEVFGFTHAHVGAQLAQGWRLGQGTRLALGHHHYWYGEPDSYPQAKLVHFADVIAHEAECHDYWVPERPTERLHEQIGISETALDGIYEQVRAASLSG